MSERATYSVFRGRHMCLNQGLGRVPPDRGVAVVRRRQQHITLRLLLQEVDHTLTAGRRIPNNASRVGHMLEHTTYECIAESIQQFLHE